MGNWGLGLVFVRFMLRVVVACLCWSSSARAEMTYEVRPIEGDAPYLLVSGTFEPSDNADQLALEVAASGAEGIVFDSAGGDVAKAMEFGRVIRSLDLMTTQVKNVECYSACVYAFMGGAYRYAGEGSLAIDRAMFDGNESLTTKESLHEFGGSLVDYSVEMGVDPNVLKLAGSVPDGNPHFLTESEMKQYLVTTLFIDDDGKVQPALETTPKTAQTQRPGNAPLPETPVRSATPEQRAQDMMLAYLHALRSGSDNALVFLQKSYADEVETDDGMTSKVDLLRKKQAFFKQWPIRFYSSDLAVARTVCKTNCAVSSQVMWYWKNAATGDARSGMSAIVLHFDPMTNKIIGEFVQHSGEREEKFGPSHMIASWDAVEGQCRLQSVDPAEVKIACQVQQEIETFLKDIGWCYGVAGKARNKRWHECVAGGPNSKIKVPQFADYPASRHKGKSVLPDFNGRDSDFREAATIIRDEMREGPNFAGHYRLVSIQCSRKGCPISFVVDHKTGTLTFLPGDDIQEEPRVSYRSDSRLLFRQYLLREADSCMIESTEIVKRQGDKMGWELIDRFDIGDAKACKRSIKENLAQ